MTNLVTRDDWVRQDFATSLVLYDEGVNAGAGITLAGAITRQGIQTFSWRNATGDTRPFESPRTHQHG